MKLPADLAPILAPSLRQIVTETDNAFDALLALPGDPRDALFNAMRHAAIGGGKRLRPLLVVASATLFSVPRTRALRAGLAAECVHVHSLIHDDLPCMDDDDLRRGKATVHRAFDEATAVLAGDALHAQAFEILADPLTHPSAQVRVDLVSGLALAVGAAGMAGGQMMDLQPHDRFAGIAEVTRMQRLKTGALIGWCVEAGAVLGEAPPSARTSLRGYAHCLGLAFQIADDLLDIESTEAEAGKRVNKDAAAGKATFVSLLGPEQTREQAHMLARQAIDHIALFGAEADILRGLAQFAVNRRH